MALDLLLASLTAQIAYLTLHYHCLVAVTHIRWEALIPDEFELTVQIRVHQHGS